MRCARCHGRGKVFEFNGGYSLVNFGGKEINCPSCLGDGKHEKLEDKIKQTKDKIQKKKERIAKLKAEAQMDIINDSDKQAS